MKQLRRSDPLSKKTTVIISQRLLQITALRKRMTIRDTLAFLIVTPFSVAYLAFSLKAVLTISDSHELIQIAQLFLFPVPVIWSLVLILSYYFRRE